MVLSVNSNQLKQLIEIYYSTKIPLFIHGTFGIGKSRIVKDVSSIMGDKKNKKPIEWMKISKAEKMELFKNPEKYFVLIDIRLSEYDSSDVKGLPIFNDDKESIDFKVPLWAKFLELENSDGIVFFDEMNLAPPLVLSSCYKIIYDRIVNESKINDNFLIIGAGNLADDRAYTHEIPPPLRDRCGEVELKIGLDEWNEWAIANGIHPYILGFNNWKNSLRIVDFDDAQKFTTPRGWERINILITSNNLEIIKKNYSILKMITSSAISEGIASEFISYCKIQDQINFEELLKNSKKMKQILKDAEISVKYFVATGISDKYKDKKVDFKKVLEVSKAFDEIGDIEMVAYMWLIMSRGNKKFQEDFIKHVDDKFCEKYQKYIM